MLKKFLASVFVAMFVVVATYLLAGLVFLRMLESGAFLNDDFYLASQEFVLSEINIELEESIGEQFANTAHPVFEEVISPANVRGVIEDLFLQFKNVKSRDGVLSFDLNFDFLLGESKEISASIAAKYYNGLPKCQNVIEYTVFAIDDLTGLSCLPADLAEIDFASAMSRYLDSKLFSDFSSAATYSIATPGYEGKSLFDLIEMIFYGALLLGVVMLLVLGIIIALVVRESKWHVLRWEMRALLFTSLALTLVFALLFALPATGDENLIYQGVILALAKNVLFISVPSLILCFIGARMIKTKLKNDAP
jgi:hypothetical protein